MMKRFVNGGKIVGLMLLAAGLIFAGCAGPNGTGGSSESSAPAAVQNSYGAVPISLDPKTGDFSIGAGDGLSDITMVAGHTVEIKNGSTSIVAGKGNCGAGGGTGDVHCWIKIINRDSDELMANVFLTGSKCKNCGTATMDNADNVNGDTTKPIGGTALSVPINGNGFCFAEDGKFPSKRPFNFYGCSTVFTPGSYKPVQMLHPSCGQRTEMFDFGNQVAKYSFYASVAAQYFPWNPLGPDLTPKTGDDDARYNFQNYTTVYMILTDFNTAPSGKALYALGSWKRSNILAGYNPAGGAVSGVSLVPGTYFSVNVAVEAPDRIESYMMADKNLFPSNPNGYEYYNQSAIMFRYNPAAVERVKAVHKGFAYGAGAKYPCYTAGNCTATGSELYQHLDVIVDNTNSLYGVGWIAFYRSIPENFILYGGNAFSLSVDYLTDNGGKIHITKSAYACRECGHKGFAKVNHAFVGGSIKWSNTNPANPAMTQDGIDAAPENTINIYHFFTRGADVVGNIMHGRGSEFRADTFGSYTQFNLVHTNSTLFPGGTKGAPSDDWTDYCAPFYVGGGNIHYCKPAEPVASYAVYQGVENQSPLILQGGEAVAGSKGGIQTWGVYVCIQ
jgi:hypothetical protein